MVEIVFLGTGGASAGALRTYPGLLIESPEFRMLAEAGPTIMQQLDRADVPVSAIDRLFVSHAHGDHVLGFPMLVFSRKDAPTPLQVYAGRHTITTLEMISAMTLSDVLPIHQLNIERHELSEQGPDELDLGPSVTLRTAVVPHHPPGTPTLSARWDFAGGPSITFVTDATPNDVSVALAHNSDLLIHGACRSITLQPDADFVGTMTAQQAGEMARRANCPRLALVHLTRETSTQPDALAAEARADTDLQVIVPDDGERLRV